MAKKRLWKLINGELYIYKCYRTDRWDAERKRRDVHLGEGYPKVEKVHNYLERRYDIYVRPKKR